MRRFSRTNFLLASLVVLAALGGCQLPFAQDFENPVDPGAQIPPPSVPTELVATPAEGQVTVAWKAATGAIGYKVFYNEGKTASTKDTAATEAMIHGTSATITGLVNDTEYAFVVLASNAVGDSGPSEPVTATPAVPETAPATPTELTATSGDGQVVVTWKAVTGATSYKVYYKEGSTASTSDTAASASMISGTTATIAGLTNGTKYAFVVMASNSVGDSAATEAVTATPAVVVPTAPTGVTATAADGQVTVSWTAPTGATGYKVFYKAGTSATTTDTAATAAMINGTSAVVTGLTNGTQYALVVVATNTAGDSPPTASVTATPTATVTAPAAPTAVTATPADGQVTVAWKAPSGATSYKVYYKAGTTATTSDTAATAAMITGTTATVAGLTNGTEYAFIVVASNSAGDSPATTAVTATPAVPVTVPGTPTGVTAIGADGQVTVNWTAPTGATGYKVYYKSGTTASTSDTAATAAMLNGTSAIITGLTNGTQYAFVVLATNSAGDSAASASVTATPAVPLSAPSAPTGVTATGADSQVTVSWTAPSGATSYKVYYKAGTTASTGDTAATAAMISGTSATITGLTNGTQYAFVVIATNSAGDSAATSAVTATPAYTAVPVVEKNVTATSVEFSWPPLTGATKYNVYRRNTSRVTTYNGTKTGDVSSPYTDSTLTAGTTYYYIVTVVYSTGELASLEIAVVTPTLAPATIATRAGVQMTEVTWASVAGATSYNLYWSTISGVTTGTGTKLSGVSSPYLHTSLTDNTTYYYVVTAVKNGAESVASTAANVTTGYIAGGVGPAGGFLFYDKGSYSGSPAWRYLELAPVDQGTAYTWSNGSDVDVTGAVGTAIGTGQANTTAIVTAQAAGTYAASICDNLTLGGYNDWFLPSQYEARTIKSALGISYGAQPLSNLNLDYGYWTSSQANATDALVYYFNNGYESWGPNNKASTRFVRAIRAF